MSTALILHDEHYQTAVEAARELGLTPDQYVESLIEGANMDIDQVLAPVRDAFAKSGITEEELDDTVTRARKEIFAREHKNDAAR